MKLGIGFSCSNNDGGHALPHVIYRFMKEKYIDEFLISGKLRLPTMDAVRRIDSDRRDSREGWLCNVFHHPAGYAIPLTSVPQEGCDYVLCAARSLMARNPCSHKNVCVFLILKGSLLLFQWHCEKRDWKMFVGRESAFIIIVGMIIRFQGLMRQWKAA